VSEPLTFIATTEAISQAGARADFVDIDERERLGELAEMVRKGVIKV